MANPYYDYYGQTKEQEKNDNQSRSYKDQMLPIYVSASLGSILVHIFSFALASLSLTHYLTHSLGINDSFYYWSIFVVICLLIFAFIEVPKYTLAKVTVENKNDGVKKRDYYGQIITLCSLVVCSILLSSWGSTLIDDAANSEADTKSIELIEDTYNKRLDNKLVFWQSKIDGTQSEIDIYEKKHEKYYASEQTTRLSSASSVQMPYKALLATKVKLETNRDNALADIRKEKDNALTAARDYNEAAISKHSENSNVSDWIMFCLMIGLEIAYVGLIYFIAYYNHRCRKEKGASEANQSEPEALPTQSKAKTQSEPKAKQSEAREEAYAPAFATKERNPIRFGGNEYAHGQIIMEEGAKKPKIAYEKANGELTFYTQATLLRMANGDKTSDANRKKLLKLANKEQWNQYQ